MKVAEEMFKLLTKQQTANSNLSLIVSALTLAVNYAHLTVDKVSIANTEISIKDPAVIVGSLGFILLYSVLVSLRYFFTAPHLISMIDPQYAQQISGRPTLWSRLMTFTSWAMMLVQVGVAVLALIVAFPSMGRIVGLVFSSNG